MSTREQRRQGFQSPYKKMLRFERMLADKRKSLLPVIPLSRTDKRIDAEFRDKRKQRPFDNAIMTDEANEQFTEATHGDS